MAGEIENFGNKRNSNGFQKNKDNINKKGQPRKLFSSVNLELKAKGIEILSKEQLIEAYGLIFNTDEDELQRIAKDKTYPFALRLIILELSNKNNRAKAMADYRDYMFGKAKQEIDNNIKGSLDLTKREIDEVNQLLELNNL